MTGPRDRAVDRHLRADAPDYRREADLGRGNGRALPAYTRTERLRFWRGEEGEELIAPEKQYPLEPWEELFARELSAGRGRGRRVKCCAAEKNPRGRYRLRLGVAERDALRRAARYGNPPAPRLAPAGTHAQQQAFRRAVRQLAAKGLVRLVGDGMVRTLGGEAAVAGGRASA